MGEYFEGLIILIKVIFIVVATLVGAVVLAALTICAFATNYYLGLLMLLIDTIGVYTFFYIFEEGLNG